MAGVTPKKNIRPLNGFILIRSAPAEGEGLVKIADVGNAQTAIQRAKPATVVAVSAGYWHESGNFLEPQVNPGDVVWMADGWPIASIPGEKNLHMVHQQAVCCVFEAEQPVANDNTPVPSN